MTAARKAACGLAALLIVAGIGFWLRPLACYDGAIYLHEALTGVRSRTVVVHGCRVHYLVQGPADGDAVVLVHGLGGSAEDWRNLAPDFARAGYRVYMPDLPGYGRSQRPQDFSYSVRDEAAVVIGFMDNLGLRRVTLGGWSMGGWIAQLVAAQQPQRVARLMLFDSAGLHIQPIWDTRLFTPTSARQLGQLEALLMPHPPAVPEFVARDILRVSATHAWVIQRALASMLTGRDVTDDLLPQLKMPVLIAWGAKDRIMPLSQGQTMHRLIPQSRLIVAAGCGHLAPLECSQQLWPGMQQFISEQVDVNQKPGTAL
ncbi:MAG TPA: alpha/beta fold hydrolase [Terracidiphilus sp.]|jgi:pimeloyl-ACP methyl ester carboxylesterase|nr:alpha/beta fold hydrolase [Terracidiphilus sp.]